MLSLDLGGTTLTFLLSEPAHPLGNDLVSLDINGTEPGCCIYGQHRLVVLQ